MSVVDAQKTYKVHFFTANWTTAFAPSPKCVQCCPDCATSLGGHGGCTCDCNLDLMIRHDPPLVFNVDNDMCVELSQRRTTTTSSRGRMAGRRA